MPTNSFSVQNTFKQINFHSMLIGIFFIGFFWNLSVKWLCTTGQICCQFFLSLKCRSHVSVTWFIELKIIQIDLSCICDSSVQRHFSKLSQCFTMDGRVPRRQQIIIRTHTHTHTHTCTCAHTHTCTHTHTHTLDYLSNSIPANTR